MHPQCSMCKKDLDNWVGDVMVPQAEYLKNKISKISVVCKECAGETDFHHLWELRWVKDNVISQLYSIIDDFISKSREWESDAVKDVYKLAAMAHPDLAKSPI